jgi:hypothetical protein
MSVNKRKVARYEKVFASLEGKVISAIRSRFDQRGLSEDDLIADVRDIFEKATAPVPPAADNRDAETSTDMNEDGEDEGREQEHDQERERE